MSRKKTSSENKSEEPRIGTLFVVATPIGNLEDITLRAIRILKEADLVAAEDTRHTRKLLSHLDISTPMISYFKDKEIARAKTIIDRLKKGDMVALVSDAGTPGISDPGAILVRQAHDHDIPVIPIPGPSALTTAISSAGLEQTSFIFLGFLPSKPSERRKMLTSLLHEQRPMAFYESPQRLDACIKDCLEIFGNRKIFWARELTKLHEELRHSTLAELAAAESEKIRGESVLIVWGCDQQEKPATEDLHELLIWYRDNSELSLKDAVQKITGDMGLSRTQVYKEALRIYKND